MRLWRLTRAPFVALNGAGPLQWGARYSSPGRPVVNFTSEAGLAVLVVLRYLPADPADRADIPDDFVLGYTEIEQLPVSIADDGDEDAIRAEVDHWLDERSSLLASIPSRVLPEGDIVMMNVAHPDAQFVPPLVTRPFDFAQCLHRPPSSFQPMLDSYRKTL